MLCSLPLSRHKMELNDILLSSHHQRREPSFMS
ncbi:UNVERIFIED_CONTAM: hypothetical protein GTU68_018226 [Idotea baltica]|nr:hypothetical protein [Idotea baltica]